MIAAGIDLGGTKIEAQIFDRGWKLVATERVSTPKTYEGLISALKKLVSSCGDVPVGISAAGLIHPEPGVALTSNLPATGRTLVSDVVKVTKRPLVWINDARALLLSEAVFGVGEGVKRVAGVIIGTGIGSGLSVDGRLQAGTSGTSGEIGHIALPAHLVQRYNLPLVACGCGRVGCMETLIAGPGLVRIARAVKCPETTPKDIAAERGKAWQIWCELTAEMLFTLNTIGDPELIILAGGLSKVPHLVEDLKVALTNAQFKGFPIPDIRIAKGGDASGALGAAYVAWRQSADD